VTEIKLVDGEGVISRRPEKPAIRPQGNPGNFFWSFDRTPPFKDQ
jgi:hypothetical protein